MKATVRTTCWLATGLLGIFLGRLALPDVNGTEALAFFKQVAARVAVVARAIEARENPPEPPENALPDRSSADAASPQQTAQQQRRVRGLMTELQEKLGLDAEQVAKLRPIVEHSEWTANQAMQEWFSNNGPREGTPPPGNAMRESHELADSQITALLRPNQEEKFQAWVQERKERVRHVAHRRDVRPPPTNEMPPPPPMQMVQDA